jgi:Ca2+/Na+ antiporter
MIMTISAVILAIVMGLGILVAWMAWKKKKAGKLAEPNYRSFLVMGIILVPASIASMAVYFVLQIPFVIAMPLLVLGLVYLAIGLANRDKWPQSDKSRESSVAADK